MGGVLSTVKQKTSNAVTAVKGAASRAFTGKQKISKVGQVAAEEVAGEVVEVAIAALVGGSRRKSKKAKKAKKTKKSKKTKRNPRH